MPSLSFVRGFDDHRAHATWRTRCTRSQLSGRQGRSELTGAVDEIAPIRGRDRLGLGVDAKLVEDVLEVRRNGLPAENEARCDLPGIEPFGQQRKDFSLSFRQA
jgi:hypothetical protein